MYVAKVLTRGPEGSDMYHFQWAFRHSFRALVAGANPFFFLLVCFLFFCFFFFFVFFLY